jgi:hypothetical protein
LFVVTVDDNGDPKARFDAEREGDNAFWCAAVIEVYGAPGSGSRNSSSSPT